MDPLLNRRTLPVQLTILLLTPPESLWENLCHALQHSFPGISCQFYVLAIADKDDQNHQLCLRRKLEQVTTRYLESFHHHILIRSGPPVETILTTAVQHQCDLVLLCCNESANLWIYEKPIKVRSLIKHSPLPIMIFPESKINQEITTENCFSFKRTLIQANPEETNRLCSAFALRCARLLQTATILTCSIKPADSAQHVEYLNFLRDRYWTSHDPPLMLLPQTGRSPAGLLDAINETDPNLVILTLNQRSAIKRNALLDTIKPIIQSYQLPIIIVQRHDWMKDMEKKFLSTFHSFSEYDLARTNGTEPGTLKLDFDTNDSDQLMLGYYSQHGLTEAFTRYGLLKSLARRGYPSTEILFGRLDGSMERLQVFDRNQSPTEPLIDIVFRQEFIPNFDVLPTSFPSNVGPFLYIEWLCIQDPRRTYRDLEIPLPGQKYPGLGIGWKVLLIIKMLARRIGAAAIYNMPEYYHTARLYHRYFRYLDPFLEGRLLALDRDTFPRHVVDTSWAFLHNLVLENNEPCPWIGGPQILPLHPDIEAYFKSDDYNRQVRDHLHSQRFMLELDRMREMIKDRTLYRHPGEYRRSF